MFDDLFARRLVLVSGKGGVGKTTVAAALASLAARAGKRVLLISTDGRGDAAALFGKEDQGYAETPLEPNLRGLTGDFDPLLADFVATAIPVQAIRSRILSSSTFRYFTRATPGLPDLLLLGKVRQILLGGRAKKGRAHVDLIVIDAPATGHALALVGIPRALLKTIPAGPLRKVALDLDGLLGSPGDACLVVVAEPAELAAREAEEIVEGALARAGLATRLLVVNRIGRGGSPAALPRLELPVARVPEIDANGDAEAGSDEAFAADKRFFAVFRDALSGVERPKRALSRRSAPQAPDHPLDLGPWLDDSRLLVLAGPGGVGKTTLAAAAGIAAARRGRRVLVLTVDPARRLAQALGLEGNAGTPVEVKIAGLPRRGGLKALQIDPKATFERLLPRVASASAVERIRSNRLYAGLVDSLPGVLEYMGVEALSEHSRSDEFDLIVLDTPPAARGLDFLSAPDRMVALLEHDALRWFLRGDSLLSRALSGASRGAAALLKLADRLLGFGFLSDLADFFRVFDGLYEGFKERSEEISAQLAKGRFLVVSSPDRSPLATAAETAGTLRARGVEVALLLNRVPADAPRLQLPPILRDLPSKWITEAPVNPAELPVFLANELV